MAAATFRRALPLALAFGLFLASAPSGVLAQTSGMTGSAPMPDPRVGLRAGQYDAAEKNSVTVRRQALSRLAAALRTEADAASDAPKARMLAAAVGELATAR